LFFADKVIICEGFDEYVVKAASRELFPRKLDAENVSVIAVNGKDNIAPLVQLVLGLGLECYIVADFDFLLRDKSNERNKYDAKAHAAVVNLPLAFFQQPRLFGANGQEVVSLLAKVRTKIKSQSEKAFYTAKTVSEIPLNGTKELVAAMRRAGIGLLDGQVEDLSIDPRFLSSTNKLDLSKIYEIRGKLVNRVKFSSIMKLEQLRELLAVVFADKGNAASQFTALKDAAAKIK
jgi:hypothetical protein